jgi:hypothetical protein
MNCVVDNNVVLTSIEGVNPRGADDHSPWDLFDRIQEICSPIFCSPAMVGTFQGFVWQRSKLNQWNPECSGLMGLLTRWSQTQKLVLVDIDDLPLLPFPLEVKDEDRPFVRIARAKDALLVSYDEKLKTPAAKNGVQLLPPIESIPLIRR